MTSEISPGNILITLTIRSSYLWKDDVIFYSPCNSLFNIRDNLINENMSHIYISIFHCLLGLLIENCKSNCYTSLYSTLPSHFLLMWKQHIPKYCVVSCSMKSIKDDKFARVSKISHLIFETLVHVRIWAPNHRYWNKMIHVLLRSVSSWDSKLKNLDK